MQHNEIHITDDGGNTPDIDVLLAITTELNAIVKDNIVPFEEFKLDPMIAQIREAAKVQNKPLPQELIDNPLLMRNFYLNSGKIVGYDFEWGHKRDILDDMIVLSGNHPEYLFTVIRTWTVTSQTKIENLDNFWKGEFQMGVMQDSFTAKPIEWVSNSQNNWYL